MQHVQVEVKKASKMPVMAAHPVLCQYRVYSAYKEIGFLDGWKMIHVNKSSEIFDEFVLQMDREMADGGRQFGVPSAYRYVFLSYRPYCGKERF